TRFRRAWTCTQRCGSWKRGSCTDCRIGVTNRSAPMNINERRLHEMLERVNAFGSAQATDFPAGTIGHQAFATVGGCVRDVVRQATGHASERRRGAAASKARARKVLWA